MLEFMIGAASFFCGFALMFAIHRVMFDYYDEDAKQEIYDLKCQVKALEGDNFELKAEIEEQKRTLNKINIQVHEFHTFATPDDVTNIQFWESGRIKMSISEFYDYIAELKDECFPLIVKVKDTKGQTRVDVITYDKKADLYFWGYHCDETEEVICWVSADEAIERFYDDSYSDS